MSKVLVSFPDKATSNAFTTWFGEKDGWGKFNEFLTSMDLPPLDDPEVEFNDDEYSNYVTFEGGE